MYWPKVNSVCLDLTQTLALENSFYQRGLKWKQATLLPWVPACIWWGTVVWYVFLPLRLHTVTDFPGPHTTSHETLSSESPWGVLINCTNRAGFQNPTLVLLCDARTPPPWKKAPCPDLTNPVSSNAFGGGVLGDKNPKLLCEKA